MQLFYHLFQYNISLIIKASYYSGIYAGIIAAYLYIQCKLLSTCYSSKKHQQWHLGELGAACGRSWDTLYYMKPRLVGTVQLHQST